MSTAAVASFSSPPLFPCSTFRHPGPATIRSPWATPCPGAGHPPHLTSRLLHRYNWRVNVLALGGILV
ncbi:Uncharacterized protein HZ326_10307 [Fusarium oxysporum f. sp. albedinis]|nr:Uncharacterized protein HZ326_10307 [Fusarium oxysporum f. sp. albedinis]